MYCSNIMLRARSINSSGCNNTCKQEKLMELVEQRSQHNSSDCLDAYKCWRMQQWSTTHALLVEAYGSRVLMLPQQRIGCAAAPINEPYSVSPTAATKSLQHQLKAQQRVPRTLLSILNIYINIISGITSTEAIGQVNTSPANKSWTL